jgi:nitronate monooxygenase
MLKIRGREARPLVQGGMGVGISAHRLAGSVAREGCVGTISSVDLRRHHPDLMRATGQSRDKQAIEAANLVALDREIRAAREIAAGEGIIAVNVMRAVSQYAGYVRQACESGADAIVVGAGLPFDLPELTADYPRVALIPILSEARAVGLVLRKWMRKGRLPDAIVIEHPRYAGGHLGAAKIDEVGDARFDFSAVLPAAEQLFAELGIAPIPIIVAGGINSPERVQEAMRLGAAGVQVGTPFAVTEESDAHVNFKRVLAGAQPEDIVTFMSVAGLPARAIRTPWLSRYLDKEAALQERARKRAACTLAFDCLAQCGLRDGLARSGQFCIDHHLAAALRGDVEHGLFFRGSEPVPFGGEIRPVRDLAGYLLGAPAPRAH